jgi:hypothetical protein
MKYLMILLAVLFLSPSANAQKNSYNSNDKSNFGNPESTGATAFASAGFESKYFTSELKSGAVNQMIAAVKIPLSKFVDANFEIGSLMRGNAFGGNKLTSPNGEYMNQSMFEYYNYLALSGSYNALETFGKAYVAFNNRNFIAGFAVTHFVEPNQDAKVNFGICLQAESTTADRNAPGILNGSEHLEIFGGIAGKFELPNGDLIMKALCGLSYNRQRDIVHAWGGMKDLTFGLSATYFATEKGKEKSFSTQVFSNEHGIFFYE